MEGKNLKLDKDLQINSLEALEKIKSPEGLFKFLSKNMKYGFVKKTTKEIIDHKQSDWSKDIDKEYFLQSPEEYIKSKHGVCFDSVELERYWFSFKGYKFQTFFIVIPNTSLPTHTFLSYQENDKYYWFEFAWYKNKGIHEYKSFSELIKDVKEKKIEALKESGASIEDMNNLNIYKYGKPIYGSSIDDFAKTIINNNEKINIELI